MRVQPNTSLFSGKLVSPNPFHIAFPSNETDIAGVNLRPRRYVQVLSRCIRTELVLTIASIVGPFGLW